MDLHRLRPEAAEFGGTFALVLLGAGGPSLLGVFAGPSPHWVGALLSGLVVGICAHFLGRVSGAHFNPAVTFGFVAVSEFPARRSVSYVIAQLVGAVLGAVALFGLVGAFGSGAITRPAPDVGPGFAIAAEAGSTFLLMIVVMGVATDGRAPAWSPGPAIGGAVAIGTLFAGPFTGGSMNPARTIGPGVVFGLETSVWIYFVGPSIGSLAAALVYSRFLRGKARKNGARGEVAPARSQSAIRKVS